VEDFDLKTREGVLHRLRMLKALLQTTKLGGADFSKQKVKDSKIENLPENPDSEAANPEDPAIETPSTVTTEPKKDNTDIEEKLKWNAHIIRIEDLIRQCMESGNELTAEDIDLD